MRTGPVQLLMAIAFACSAASAQEPPRIQRESPRPGMPHRQPATHPIETAPSGIAAFIGAAELSAVPTDTAVLVSDLEEFTEKFGGYAKESPFLAPAVEMFFANGGTTCYVVRVEGDADAIIGTDDGAGSRTGLQVLTALDDISIVCIPGIVDTTVQRAVIRHCETMGDRMCILDLPEHATPDMAADAASGLSSSRGFASLYYPWVYSSVETPVDGEKTIEPVPVPPSGAVAGIYIRTALHKGIHKAPANEVLAGVQRPTRMLTESELTALTAANVNTIRAFSGKGVRVWGARTTSNSAEWKYVNVRRLLISIEESVRKGSQWAVFEPNDQRLWDNLRESIEDYLNTLWKAGALVGSKPEQAFFVKCDRTTMTQSDIDNGRIVCLIGVAPVRPAEFIIISLSLWSGDSSIQE